MNLLEVKDLITGYGRSEIIHGISLHVKKEEIVTIIGPNGSGKSTFLKAIMGNLESFQGKIFFDGRDITDTRTIQRTQMGMAFVPQLDNIFPSLSVGENLEMGGYSLKKNELRKRIESMFEIFPVLEEKSKMNAGNLSGGQRQLVAMARALLVRPVLMLLDEPSAGLSPKISEEVFDKIEEIASTGTSMIIVEQDAEQSLSISNRGYVFAMGKSAFEGPADAILSNKKIREAYLGG